MAEFNYSSLGACGQDVIIAPNAEIRRPHLVKIGSHVSIDHGFYCTSKMEIGDYIHIAPYTTVIGGEPGLLRMAHFSGIAAGSRVVCVSDEYNGEGLVGPIVPKQYRDKSIVAPVIFEMFACVGTNVVMLPGVTLAEGSVVAACSLITQSTEPWTVYAGVPARAVKRRPKEKMIEAAKAMGYL